jgi:hypothetical protein
LSDTQAASPKEGLAWLLLLVIASPGNASRARYCTGTVIGCPLSAIKQPRIRAGSFMLV